MRRLMPATITRNSTAPTPSMNLGKSGICLAILASLLAILVINRDAPIYTNADSLLFPIMSLQHVTVFYWGQNRIVNFVPMILSPISSSEWNFLLHLLVFAMSFFWLILFAGYWMFQLAFPKASAVQCQAFTAIFLLITISIIQPGALFEMIGSGDPYALSYLALLVAARLAMKRFGLVNILATFGCLAVAVGLNPSILIPALFGSVMFAYFGYVSRYLLNPAG
jgi:hypothetical protein